MFLKSLYDFAMRHHLLDEMPLQMRDIHFLIPLTSQGELRSPYLLPLTQTDKKGKERLGQQCLMPRFPGSNNGGKAYFLAADSIAVLGRHKLTGDPIPADSETAPRNQKTYPKAFQHFWQQIDDAFQSTKDPRLAALLAFRRRYIRENDGKIEFDLPFLKVQHNKKTRKPEFVGLTGSDESQYRAMKGATIAFSVNGQPLTLADGSDPLRRYWFDTFSRLAFQSQDNDVANDVETNVSPTVCLITGKVGQPVARSHKPTILGIPGLTSGGYLVSFAKDSPAFSSYGFSMGENAPVSETATAAYALALNHLLDDEDLHYNLGPLAVCFWAIEHDDAAKQINNILNRAYPEQVKAFLRQPLEGRFDREVLRRECIYTIALTANAGRVVVVHWLAQPLNDAIDNLKIWEHDIDVVSLYPQTIDSKSSIAKDADAKRPPPPPLSIPALARVSLRRSKAQKDDRLVVDRIVQLYHAAMDKTFSLPITMLKPILDEFQSALVKDSDSSPTYPFNLSRFALIKLILIRITRKEGGFMPEVELANTSDPAYNCGRLLAILQALQNRSRRAGKPKEEKNKISRPSAGVVERYYGRASTAPALVFPLLIHLSRHHLAKLQKGNESDKKAASAIEHLQAKIMVKLRSDPTIPDAPPEFPRFMHLIEQGRFALGFYQQKAYNNKQSKLYMENHGKDSEDIDDDGEESYESQESSD